jgi:hypothetical protein
MAATIPNIAKGRINEYVIRVDGNDPATAQFVIMLLQDTGLETLAVLRDYDDFAAILAAANTEVGVASYARLALTDTDVAPPTVDDGGDQQTFDTADFDYGTLEAGETVAASVIGYDAAQGGDATIIPVQITIPAATVDTNGETFHWRTPNGWWAATE